MPPIKPKHICECPMGMVLVWARVYGIPLSEIPIKGSIILWNEMAWCHLTLKLAMHRYVNDMLYKISVIRHQLKLLKIDGHIPWVLDTQTILDFRLPSPLSKIQKYDRSMYSDGKRIIGCQMLLGSRLGQPNWPVYIHDIVHLIV